MTLHIDTTRHDNKAGRINRARRTNRGIGRCFDDAPIQNPQITNFSIDTIGGTIDPSREILIWPDDVIGRLLERTGGEWGCNRCFTEQWEELESLELSSTCTSDSPLTPNESPVCHETT